MAKWILVAMALAVSIIWSSPVKGHGLLTDPPARNTIWRDGFPNPVNYNDMGLNCGGFGNQWTVNGGKCGACGDPYQGPRLHEAGYSGPGKGYANGIVGRHYRSGDVIPVQAKITANHLGYLTFKLCPVSNPQERVSQQCFDKYPLSDVYGNTKFHVYDFIGNRPGVVRLSLQIPRHLTCDQCVMQWFYQAGNNNGPVETTPQETFINCADIQISMAGGPQPTPPPAAIVRSSGKHKRDSKGNMESDELWDCDLVSTYNDPEKAQKTYDWCINNCIIAIPQQRQCPSNMCQCYVASKGKEQTTYRPNPDNVKNTTPDSGDEKMRSVKDWSCDLVSPYDKSSARKVRNLKTWCIENCVRPLPQDRNCPANMCNCYRTSGSDQKTTARPVVTQPTPTTRGRQNPSPTKAPTRSPGNDRRSLSNWRCEGISPYDKGNAGKKLKRWCEVNCVEAEPHQRNCPSTHCNCYEISQRIHSQPKPNQQQPVRSTRVRQGRMPPTEQQQQQQQQSQLRRHRQQQEQQQQSQLRRQQQQPPQEKKQAYINQYGEIVTAVGTCRLSNRGDKISSSRESILHWCADVCLIHTSHQYNQAPSCPTGRCSCKTY